MLLQFVLDFFKDLPHVPGFCTAFFHDPICRQGFAPHVPGFGTAFVDSYWPEKNTVPSSAAEEINIEYKPVMSVPWSRRNTVDDPVQNGTFSPFSELAPVQAGTFSPFSELAPVQAAVDGPVGENGIEKVNSYSPNASELSRWSQRKPPAVLM